MTELIVFLKGVFSILLYAVGILMAIYLLTLLLIIVLKLWKGIL